MERWKMIFTDTGGLKVRSGPGTTYSQVESLAFGDIVEGVLDTAKNWINISKITRVNGAVRTPTAPAQWWCSGSSTYVEKIVPPPPPPPVVKVTSINIKLAAGSTVTTVYSDGSQKVETA